MKKIAAYFTCMFLASSFAFCQVNLTNKLLLEYLFSGNSLDQSGNGVNATPHNGPVFTTDRFGAANSAYLFDGISQYLDMSATTLTPTQFSYSLWAFPTSNDAIEALLSIGSNTENQNILLSFQDGWIGGSFINNVPFTANTPTVPALNKWYHIVFTRDSSLIQLYVNGDSVSSMVIPNMPAGYGASPLANIARRANTASEYYQGKIDDIRIYSRVINKQEIKALFDETQTTTTQGILDMQNLNFTVAPNPTSGDVYINLPKVGTYEVVVQNAQGELIFNQIYNDVLVIPQLSLQNKENGIYILTIKSSEGMGTKKLVLN